MLLTSFVSLEDTKERFHCHTTKRWLSCWRSGRDEEFKKWTIL